MIKEWLEKNALSKTGRLASANFLLKKFPNEMEEVMKVTSSMRDDEPLGIRLQAILCDKAAAPLCRCGERLSFNRNTNDYRRYCSQKCLNADPLTVTKRQATMLDRYGVTHAGESEILREKSKQTTLARYGVEHVSQADMVKEQRRAKNLAEYGVEHFFQSDEAKEKISKTLNERYGGHHLATEESMEKLRKTNIERYGHAHQVQRPEIQEQIKKTMVDRYGDLYVRTDDYKKKREETCVEKYGVAVPQNLESVKEKAKQTNLKKYGVEHHLKLETQQEKVRQSNQEKYGVDYVSQVPEHIERAKATFLERYGVDNPSKSEIVKKKTRKTSLERYGEISPSKNLEIKNRIRNTNISKYGVDTYIKHEDFSEKSKNTSLSKYGCEFPAQSELVKAKITNSNIEKYGSHISQTHITEYGMQLLDDDFFKNAFTEANGDIDLMVARSNRSYDRLVTRAYELGLKTRQRSSGEVEVENFIKSLGLECETTRKIISPYEIDIFIPERGIGIEYCGLYWHSEPIRDRHYHEMKMKMMNDAGYRLITIFENEWKDKRENVERALRSILNSNNERSIPARKTSLVVLSFSDAKPFFEKNHIQGSAPSFSVVLGLMYENELVAAMGFIKQKNEWNLARFATSAHVMGGAGKLLKGFQKLYDWEKIISFADLRWSEGNLYRTLGFTEERTIRPDYYYVSPNVRYVDHKFNHRKKKYKEKYDIENMTETEIMLQEGWRRIWDCGKIKFVMEKEK